MAELSNKDLSNRDFLAGISNKKTINDFLEERGTTEDQFDKKFNKVFSNSHARKEVLRNLKRNQKERNRAVRNLTKRAKNAEKAKTAIILNETNGAKAAETTEVTKSVNSDKKQAEPIDLYAVEKQKVDDIGKELKCLEARIKDLKKKEDSTIQDIARLDEEIKKQAELLSNLRREKRSKNASLRAFRSKMINVNDQITTCTSELKQAEEKLKQMNTVDVLIYENSDFEVADITKTPISDPRKSENFTARVINACAELNEKPSFKNLSLIDIMSVSVAKIIKEDNPDRNIKFIFENGDKLLDILKALEK